MTEIERIYREHFSDVYRYIVRLSGDEHIAEEVTSDTFFKAMKSLDKFRGDCDVRVWLCTIAKNCYYNRMKKQSKFTSHNDTTLDQFVDTDSPPDERLSDRDEAAYIRSILHKIPEPYKEVFIWRVYAELSFKEIGHMFGKTENWACVTYHRARKMLTERMEEDK